MRLNRATLLLLGGLIAFIAVAVVILNSGSASSTANATPTLSQSEALVLPDVRFADVQRLTIANAEGESLTLIQDEQGTWSIEGRDEPIQQMATDTAVANLVNAQAFDRFTADDLAPFGLAEPLHTFTLHTPNGEVVLHTGNRNPGGTRVYAARPDQPGTVFLLSNPSHIATLTAYLANPPVVVITPTAAPSLTRPGLLFPEYDSTRIVRVSLVNNATEENLTLVKGSDNVWTLDPFSTNYQARALDQLLASTLAQAFAGLRALDVLNGVDEAALGLAEPLYTLTATRDDGFEFVVRLGAADPSGARQYARIFDIESVAVMDRAELASIVQFIGQPPFEAAFTFEATEEATPEVTPEATP